MYYFKKDDKMSYKYNVTFDEEKVKELREKIIYKCGIKKHYEYESDSFYPNMYSGLISNYKEYPVGDNEYDTETRTIYHYSYDKIDPYYKELLGLIKFNLVDSICNDEIDRVKDFLNVNKVLVKK